MESELFGGFKCRFINFITSNGMDKNTWIAVVVSIFVVGFFLFGGTIVNLFSQNEGQIALTQDDVMNTNNGTGGVQSLVMQDEVIGTGPEAVNGSLVSVHYTGTLTNGQKFDSSRDRGVPFEFILGSGSVIPGWEQGLLGMKTGGKRILIIPPQLAYGSQAIGNIIPANSTLVFEVELVSVSEGN